MIKVLPLRTDQANKSNGILFAATILLLQLVVLLFPGMPELVSAQEKIVLPNNPPFIQKPNPTKIVVFIHGINGDPVETWENEDQTFFWPRALAEDPDFSNADVLSFGYESECGPSLNIREIATHLYTTLETAMAKTPYRSLSFVAHSMGGLVVREFILTHLQKLHVPLDSMVLMSTPNLGSSLANMVKAFCRSDSLMDLRDGRSGYIDALNDRWREQFEQPDSIKPFHFAAGYELVPMSWFTGRVVDKESAIAFANQVSAFKKDHSTIVKLNGPTDPAYTWVKGRLLKAAPSPQEKPLSEAEEQRYTEIIGKLQEELRGTDLERALKLIAEDRLDDALALLSEKENAEDEEIEKIARARFAKAQVLELQLLYRDALEYYAKAVQLAPTNTTYLNELGLMHATLGDYDQAIAYYEKALASNLKTFGPEHPAVATGWNNLGGAWRAKGDYDQAIAYYEKALASNLKTFGPEHPAVATGWNNLGGAWHTKGDYDQAIAYYEKALASDLKIFGPEHPAVATGWNNLGGAWHTKGDYDQAIAYYEKALASNLKIFGPEHPAVATGWNNLGGAWDAKGDYDQAIAYYEKALASNLKTFGPVHPAVATGWNNLGLAWDAKGDYDQAIAYYQKALASDLKTFGPEHPAVATRWSNLGGAWRAKGDYDQAIAYYQKALASNLKTFGPEHPAVATRWSNLGAAWGAKGDYDQAIAYYEKALASDLKTFGPEHPAVATGWNNLGGAWHTKGDYDQAIAYYQKALASNLKTFGPEHPAVATRWNNLGAAWYAKGDYDQAIAYYQKALASGLKIFGPEHPAVATRWSNLGVAWYAKGDYDQAIAYYEKALASNLKTFGQEHPDVATGWNNLGGAWRAKGDYDQAIAYYQKALKVYKQFGLDHRVRMVEKNLASSKKNFESQ